jgi:hypothetical protein
VVLFLKLANDLTFVLQKVGFLQAAHKKTFDDIFVREFEQNIFWEFIKVYVYLPRQRAVSDQKIVNHAWKEKIGQLIPILVRKLIMIVPIGIWNFNGTSM